MRLVPLSHHPLPQTGRIADISMRVEHSWTDWKLRIQKKVNQRSITGVPLLTLAPKRSRECARSCQPAIKLLNQLYEVDVESVLGLIIRQFSWFSVRWVGVVVEEVEMGCVHNVLLEHTTLKTSWNLRDFRNIRNSNWKALVAISLKSEKGPRSTA